MPFHHGRHRGIGIQCLYVALKCPTPFRIVVRRDSAIIRRYYRARKCAEKPSRFGQLSACRRMLFLRIYKAKGYRNVMRNALHHLAPYIIDLWRVIVSCIML